MRVGWASAAILAVMYTFPAGAQPTFSAYRVLGQANLRQNGVNRVEGVEVNNPSGIAIERRGGLTHLYISDTGNHRVLGWRDTGSYQIGDPPEVVLGQPSPKHSAALGIGTGGFNQPVGLAVDPTTGNLYVADTGNHRVLRFPYPFSDPSRIEPDAVYGQPNLQSRTANSSGIGRGSMNRPTSLAFDIAGNLWVADSANNRILRFNPSALNSRIPEAELVLGQLDFNFAAPNRGAAAPSAAGFDNPTGLAFDEQQNLFVCDTNNARVLRFNVPVQGDSTAAVVFGQPVFTSRGVNGLGSNLALGGPTGVAVSPNGNLFVSVPRDNRIMVFDARAGSGLPARDIYGQSDFDGTQPNSAAFPLASPRTLSAPSDVRLDPEGNLYVADSGNNRVMSYPGGVKLALRVWGQNDFSANGTNQVKPGSVNAPYKIAIDYSSAPFPLYVCDTNNHRILGWRDSTAWRTGDPADLVIGQPDLTTAFANIDTRGATTPSGTSLRNPRGITVDQFGNLYVADSGNHRVLRYPPPFGQPGRVAPDLVIGQPDFQSASSALVSATTLKSPSGVGIGPDGNLFVSDTGNNRVLEFRAGDSSRPAAIRVYGQPNFNSSLGSTQASAQTLLSPQGLFVDNSSTLYVADAGNNRVLVYPNTKDVAAMGTAALLVIGQDTFSVSAFGGGPSRMRVPIDVVVDDSGNIYVSDSGNHRVLVFTSLLFLPLSGAAATQAIGQPNVNSLGPNWNSPDGLATPEGLFLPVGLFSDRRETLYVGDAGNNRVVHFLKPLVAKHAASAQANAPLARGGMVELSGSGLTDGSSADPVAPLPRALAGRQVWVDDELPVPLASIAPDRINFQMLSLAPLGQVRISVRTEDTRELIAGSMVSVASVSPGLFPATGRQGILNEDGSANSAGNAALKGSIIRIFGTGQGPVSPSVGDGEAAGEGVNTVAVPTSDGNACLVRQPSVCVAVGNVFAEVRFSGLVSGQVALWELRVRVPIGAPSGNTVPLRALINGAPSNIVSVAIR